MERDGCLRTLRTVEVHQGGDVEVGDDIAVHHEEGGVDPGLACGKANGTGRVEELRFHGVAQLHAGSLSVREGLEEAIGKVAKREHGLGHAVSRQVGEHALEHRRSRDGEELLRSRVGERTHARPLTTYEDDRLHR